MAPPRTRRRCPRGSRAGRLCASAWTPPVGVSRPRPRRAPAAERADYEAKVAARAGRKGRAKGKQPKPPEGTPRGGEQSNLSDPDSRLMRKSKRHEFRQAYNAQAVVDAGGSQLIVGARVSNCASDRNELVADIEAIAADLGRPETVLADNGYANGAEVAALEASGIEALVATAAEGRRRRHDFRPTKAGTAVREAKAEWLREMGEQARKRRRAGAVQAASANRRAGVRRHQGGPRLHRLLAARPRQGGRRVGLGGAGLQLQAPAQAHAGDGVMTAFLARLLDANGSTQPHQCRKSTFQRSLQPHPRHLIQRRSCRRQTIARSFKIEIRPQSPTDC